MQIRTVAPRELPGFIQEINVGFLHPPMSPEALTERAALETHAYRDTVATEGSTIVATMRSFPTELRVPGGVLPAASITGVTVRPTHRRRGTLRALMTRELMAAADRSEPVAVLIASEWPIYGRFGFAPATEHATYEVDSRAAQFQRDVPGSVELVEPASARGSVEGIDAAHHRRTPGEVTRESFRWDWALGLRARPGTDRWNGRLALYRDVSGAPAGFVRFTPQESWTDRVGTTTLIVDELVAGGA